MLSGGFKRNTNRAFAGGINGIIGVTTDILFGVSALWIKSNYINDDPVMLPPCDEGEILRYLKYMGRTFLFNSVFRLSMIPCFSFVLDYPLPFYIQQLIEFIIISYGYSLSSLLSDENCLSKLPLVSSVHSFLRWYWILGGLANVIGCVYVIAIIKPESKFAEKSLDPTIIRDVKRKIQKWLSYFNLM